VQDLPPPQRRQKYVCEWSWPLRYHKNKYDRKIDKRKLNATAVKLKRFSELA